MLASPVEGQLVRSHFEALVGQFEWLNFFLIIDQHVIDAIARLANKMLMSFDQRIEMLRTPAHQHLELLVGD